MSVATTVIPSPRKPVDVVAPRRSARKPKVTQVMPLSMALELLSGEAMFFCRTCQASAFRCTHANVSETVYGIRSRVGDFLHLKRSNAKYAGLRESLATEGQQSPIELCRYGRCILEGHHRLAAMAELLIPFVAWQIDGEDCDCADLAH